MSAAAGLLQGAHIVIAQLRGEAHWLLNDADAKQYAVAFANAMRHVPLQAAQKTIDFTTLAIVVFAMEVPRIGRSIQLAKAAAEPKQPGSVRQGLGPAQVFPFTPPAPSGAPQAPGSPPPGIAPDGLGIGPDAAE